MEPAEHGAGGTWSRRKKVKKNCASLLTSADIDPTMWVCRLFVANGPNCGAVSGGQQCEMTDVYLSSVWS
jgi:hypothetical protein